MDRESKVAVKLMRLVVVLFNKKKGLSKKEIREKLEMNGTEKSQDELYESSLDKGSHKARPFSTLEKQDSTLAISDYSNFVPSQHRHKLKERGFS